MQSNMAVAGMDALSESCENILTRRANQRHYCIIAQFAKRPWPCPTTGSSARLQAKKSLPQLKLHRLATAKGRLSRCRAARACHARARGDIDVNPVPDLNTATALQYDPEKHALGLDPRVGTGFPSGQTRSVCPEIMLKQKDRVGWRFDEKSSRSRQPQPAAALVPAPSARALISAIVRLSTAWRGSGVTAARASATAAARSCNASTPSKVGLARPSMIACQSARPCR